MTDNILILAEKAILDIKDMSIEELEKKFIEHRYVPYKDETPLNKITHAFQQSILQNNPFILQEVLKSYVEDIGYSNFIKLSNIKSRTSLYKTFNNSPKFETLIEIARVIINQNIKN